MEDRRRYRRRPMTGWAEIKVLEEGKDQEILLGYVKNISKMGIGLYAQKVLTLGTSVTLSTHFLTREGFETVKGLNGVVAWSLNKKRGLSTFGVRFQEPVTLERYPALFKLLEEASSFSDKEMTQIGLDEKEVHDA